MSQKLRILLATSLTAFVLVVVGGVVGGVSAQRATRATGVASQAVTSQPLPGDKATGRVQPTTLISSEWEGWPPGERDRQQRQFEGHHDEHEEDDDDD